MSFKKLINVWVTVFQTVSQTFNNEEKMAEDARKRIIELESERIFISIKQKINALRGRGLSESQYNAILPKLEKLRGKRLSRARICRSLKEYLVCLLDEKLIDIFNNNCVTGLDRGIYCVFARKVLSELYEYMLIHPRATSDKRLNEIFYYHSEQFAKQYNLNKKILKKIYLTLFDIMISFDTIRNEFKDRCEKEGLPFVYTSSSTSTTLLP